MQSGRFNAVPQGPCGGALIALDSAAAAAHAQMSASAPATDIKFCAIDDQAVRPATTVRIGVNT